MGKINLIVRNIGTEARPELRIIRIDTAVEESSGGLRHLVEVVADAEIKGQVRQHAPVILKVTPILKLSDVEGLERKGDLHRTGDVGQIIAEARIFEIGVVEVGTSIVEPLQDASGLEGVSLAGPADAFLKGEHLAGLLNQFRATGAKAVERNAFVALAIGLVHAVVAQRIQAETRIRTHDVPE